jgi:hypothetical protein
VRFTLEFDANTEAFGEDDYDCAYEVSRILRQINEKVGEDLRTSGVINDTNGVQVGSWHLRTDYLVGELDTTNSLMGSGDQCGEEHHRTHYQCTRPQGHTGEHAAGNGSRIAYVWR